MIIVLKNKHILKIDDFEFKCSIGKKGITKNKVEGDKKTPKGIFKLGPLFYRKDRIKKLQHFSGLGRKLRLMVIDQVSIKNMIPRLHIQQE